MTIEPGWRWSGFITSPPGLRCEVAAHTDIGRVRSRNEDSLYAGGPSFLVADGMGGYEAGDQASQAVIAAFRECLPEGAASLEQVQTALERARASVARIAASTRRGAGSTVTGLVLVEIDQHVHWLLLNIGDSRVYRHVGSELAQLTRDHSLWEEERARRGADDDSPMPGRNVITRAMGARESEPDTWILPVLAGVRFLICSDGLHGAVSDERIRAILTLGGRPEAAAAELVRVANEAGGRDNISVIVMDVQRAEGSSFGLAGVAA